ncbi:MAG: PAS domain-containing protein [Acidobacteria bacterium]|nr:PAS domain-containing protein [Acidobacteriota bacterium]
MKNSVANAIPKIGVEQALESMSDAFVLLDPEFRVAYVNSATERSVGRPAAEMIGRTHWELWPSSVGTDLERFYRSAMQTGRPASFQHHYVGDGFDHWFDIHAYPSDVGLAVYYTDITDRKQGPVEKERIERAYKAALSNTPDLVYVFDLDHRFIYANEALLTMWGRTSADSLGKNCLELGYPDWHAAMHDREIDQVIATKTPIRGEVPFIGTSGRRMYEYIFVPVLDDAGEVESIAGTTRDITERLQAEEALRRSEKLATAGRLAASISHEINNPLESVTNLLYLIECDESLPLEIRSYLELAQTELSRVSHIATQNLRFYRQGSKPTMENIQTLLSSLWTLYERRFRISQVSFAQRFFDVEPVRVFAGELRQVVANLVGNALDALDPGGCIALRQRISTTLRPGHRSLIITVADNGTGMSEETLKRIFEPFFSTKTATGTGLGLWVSKEIIEKQGGTLRVRSTQQSPYRGTTFMIILPEANAE